MTQKIGNEVYELIQIRLNLYRPWKLSRNTSLYKENFILLHHWGEGKVCAGEMAPNIRFGQTPEKVWEDFKDWARTGKEPNDAGFQNMIETSRWWRLNKPLLEAPVITSYSIPIMDPSEIQSYLSEHSQYSCFKMKVSEESAFDMVQEYFKYSAKPLRVDGNEAWKSVDDYALFVEKFRSFPIQLMEQPLAEGKDEGLEEMKDHSPWPLIADESFEFHQDLSYLKKLYHGVNIKLMKTGGPNRALEAIKKCKNEGLQIMLGCHIESSLGILSALTLPFKADYYDMDGSLLLSNEPFGLIEFNQGKVSIGENAREFKNKSFFEQSLPW